MLSDRVEVKTVYYKDHKMNRISFEKNSEYICLTYENDSRQQGTEIILDYDQCMGVFDNKVENLVSFVERNFLDAGIPIKISTMENGKPNIVECVVKKIGQIIPDNICLNDYLDGVEAYVDCTYKQINFATHLRDLNGCDSYYYNDAKYSLDKEDALLIKDCVIDGKIQFMNIPIISESDENDFLKAYEVLDDYEEALGKIGYFESINVWAREEEITGYALYV